MSSRIAEENRGNDPETFDPELAASIAEADRGEVFELTPELKADIRRQSEDNLRRGHQVRDDIRY